MPNIRRIKLNNVEYQVAGPASNSEYGLVKLSSNNDNIVDENGNNIIQGIPGITEDGGYYFPINMQPEKVGTNTLLISEANNLSTANKTLGVVTGAGINLASSHAAGSTVYNVTNNYENRIVCKMMEQGVACMNEADAANTKKIISVTINGSTYNPDSSPNGGTIQITTEESVNPNGPISQIRCYAKIGAFSSVIAGVAGCNSGNGYSLIVGQRAFNNSNASCVVGNAVYNIANSSAVIGRQHINNKQNAALFGQGHDTTNGSNNICAVGIFSDIQPDTAFAVGNGSSHTSRSNVFEVKTNGDIYVNGVKVLP